MRALATALAVFLSLGWLPTAGSAAPSRPLDLHLVQLDLPGAPAAVVPADLNGDGRPDLVVVLAYTERGELSFEESSRMDGIDALVEVLTVVPALLDRREARVYLADGAGGYRLAGEPLALSSSIISIEAGPAAQPVLVLTDAGVSVMRWSTAGGLILEPWIADPPVLAGAGAFLPGLELMRDLDGDGVRDFLLPAADGVAIYRTREGRLEQQPATRVALPFGGRVGGGARPGGRALVRHYLLPVVADVDADGWPDLLVRDHEVGWNAFQILRGAGGGRFHEPLSPLGDRSRDAEPRLIFVGDLDGDHRVELVTEEQPNADVQGLRAEMQETKRPRFVYRVHRLGPDLAMVASASRQFETEGYAFGGDDDGPALPGGFQDLNGDGKLDLVAVSLDFSLFQAVRILTVKRLSVGLDFRLWCQAGDGRFEPVDGLDLSGQFKLDLDNLRLGQLALFAGDFDGDGHADFVQMGRGRTVTVHRGRADCSYPKAADLTIAMAEPPANMALVRVEDLDGDRRADLMVTQPRGVEDRETTAPARLDLYLSRRD